jgi:hypothetical protein
MASDERAADTFARPVRERRSVRDFLPRPTLNGPPSVRPFVAVEPIDMRGSFGEVGSRAPSRAPSEFSLMDRPLAQLGR